MRQLLLFVDNMLSLPFMVVGVVHEFSVSSFNAGRRQYAEFLRWINW